MAVVFDEADCVGCGLCEANCPGDIIFMDPETGKPFLKYPEECWYCGSCRMDCPGNCITIVFPLEVV